MNQTQQTSEALEQKLQTAIEQAAQDTNTPDIGVSVGVITPEGKWTGATGVSNLDTQAATQPDDLFNIASISKSFTAATILKLQEQEKLSLDDTLGQWLPEIAAKLTNGENLTIRQLLNGTGGLYNYTDSEEYLSDSAADYLSGSKRDWQPEELVAYAYGKPLFSGGFSSEQWTYTNTGNVLAGLIAEKATDKPFKQILKEEILEPLELKNTFFTTEDVSLEKRAKGYEDFLTAEGALEQDGILEDTSSFTTEIVYATGSIVSSAEDVAIFFDSLASGDLLSPESTAEIFKYVDTAIPGDEKFGLGVNPTQLPWGKTRSKGGDFVGYKSQVDYFLNSDTTISVLVNRKHSLASDARPTLLLQAYNSSIANTLGLNDGSTINGAGGDDYLKGTSNNDVINGLEGDDIIIGKKGLDALDGGGGDDFLDGGEGNDYLFGKVGDDTLYGGQDNDFLNGGEGADLLDGGKGDDSLIGGDGQDTINGGEDNDFLSGGAGNDVLSDTQGNNILYGDDGDDKLFAGHGDDSLYGDAGSDSIWAQAGNDQIFGGIGDDTLNGGKGNDNLFGGVGHDRLTGLSGGDTLNGDSGNDTLIGGSGDDSLNGGAGDDLLRGGAGADRFRLSGGEDIIQDFQDGHDLLGLPTLNGALFSFDDLEIVQVERHTEIRWESQGVAFSEQVISSLETQMNKTVLQGIQANQITVDDFMQLGTCGKTKYQSSWDNRDIPFRQGFRTLPEGCVFF